MCVCAGRSAAWQGSGPPLIYSVPTPHSSVCCRVLPHSVPPAICGTSNLLARLCHAEACSQHALGSHLHLLQVVEETVADDDMIMIKGCKNTRAVTVLLRGANDYMLDEMDRSLHDAFCIVKRVLESGKVVPGTLAAGCCISCLGWEGLGLTFVLRHVRYGVGI